MLLNKKSMATLNELSSKLQELKGNLGVFEEQKEKAVAELRTSKANLKDLGKQIRNLEAEISSYDIVIGNQTDPAQKAELESQKAAKEVELREAITQRDRIIELGQARSDAENQIKTANTDIQAVIAEFASDPRINDYLQEAIEIKYDEQIEAKKAEKVKKMNLAEKFSLDLKEESAFGALVSDMVKNYAALKALPTFALDDEAKKTAASVRGAFTKSVNKLKAAIAARPEYADLILTNDDFEAIVAGPNADGKYEIPTFQETFNTIDRTVADLEDRKEKVLGRVRAALAAERIDPVELKRLEDAISEQMGLFDTYESEEKAQEDIIADLETKISDLKSSFVTVDVETERKAAEDAKKAYDDKETEVKAKEDEIKAVKDEKEDLDTQIAAVGFNQTRFDELTAKADVPAELIDARDAAQAEFDAAEKALKDKKYLSPEMYKTQLETDECKNAFGNFKAADLAVRQAFLRYKTENSEEAKQALKDAMENYKVASQAMLTIPGMEDLTVESWHDYLVRQVNHEARRGDVDEAYYENAYRNRLGNIRAEYSDVEGAEEKIMEVEKSALGISDLEEKFLKGEKVEFDADIAPKFEEYSNKMNDLFAHLKAKGVKGLTAVGDLFGKLTAQIATTRVGKFLSKIKNWFNRKNDSKRISGTKLDSERKENSDLIDAYKAKKAALAKAKDDIDAHIESKLEPDEVDELKDLQEKEKKAKSLLAKKAEKETRETELGTELADLISERDDAKRIAEEKQAEYDAVKDKGAATPEQQAELAELEDKKSAAITARDEAKGKKEAAKTERERLEQEKANLKPERPTSVVDKARNVAHGQGQELVEEAIKGFERDDDR